MEARLREWICRTGGRIQELPLAVSVRTATWLTEFLRQPTL